jgi:hypothetical protein
MTIILILVSIIAGIAALVFLLALVAPKGYSINRQVLIARPADQVFAYLKHLKNQDHYNIWAMRDPSQKREFRGVDGTKGFVYAWDGNRQAGKGEQEIMHLEQDKSIDIEVRFERPFKAIAKTPFALEAQPGNQTRVTWSMISPMSYPMNALLLFMNMDKALGKDVQTSLGILKKILETK